jgi:hypothetical protein
MLLACTPTVESAFTPSGSEAVSCKSRTKLTVPLGALTHCSGGDVMLLIRAAHVYFSEIAPPSLNAGVESRSGGPIGGGPPPGLPPGPPGGVPFHVWRKQTRLCNNVTACQISLHRSRD